MAAVIPLALVVMVSSGTARASSETVIYSFSGGADGAYPGAGVVRDPAAEARGIVPAGTLFGTTQSYGEHPNKTTLGGTLFMLTPPTAAGAGWKFKVLHQFNGGPGSDDGFSPLADLAADAAGNLYGTTAYGGDFAACPKYFAGCGTVFELSPPASAGGEWTYRMLHRFDGGRQGSSPGTMQGKLTFDPSGNGVLYGNTSGDGDPRCHCGNIFALTPPGTNGNITAHWVLGILHQFREGNDGQLPLGTLTYDSSNPPNLIGTAQDAHNSSDIVFELLPPGSPDNPVSHWSEKPIHRFNDNPSGDELFGVVIDGNGVLYGAHTDGTVFEILPPSLSTTGKRETITLYRFPAGNEGSPKAGLLRDSATGKLYGTTAYDSEQGGTVFEIAPTGNLRVWKETVLASFSGPPSYTDLNFGADGNLYGTTVFGGAHGAGTVFQVIPPQD
jgi:uncharacterized repeat protein (TIGR03803 family)